MTKCVEGRDVHAQRAVEKVRGARAGEEEHIILFFFSSRRRHTRFDCDWSSDVCSSDLGTDQRADIDNAAACGAEVFCRFLRGKDQAENIEIELLVEVLFSNGFQWRKVVNRSEEHTS